MNYITSPLLLENIRGKAGQFYTWLKIHIRRVLEQKSISVTYVFLCVRKKESLSFVINYISILLFLQVWGTRRPSSTFKYRFLFIKVTAEKY